MARYTLSLNDKYLKLALGLPEHLKITKVEVDNLHILNEVDNIIRFHFEDTSTEPAIPLAFSFFSNKITVNFPPEIVKQNG